MPIETPLNPAPYHDDRDPTKNYQRVLFKPSTSVQTRELNELQAIFQEQIERLGNNLLVKGTIVDGCNFVFHESYPYVKIIDTNQDGAPAIPANYVGLIVKNEASGLSAYVRSSVDGFVSSDPDLKTLYIKYLNTGSDSNTFVFTAGDALKVTDINLGVWSVTVNNGGLGFSNSDSLVVNPALVVNVSTGSFTNGEYIINNFGANVQIIGIDTTTLLDTNQIILSVQARGVDLADPAITEAAWAIANGESIINVSNTVAAVVEQVIGLGLQGTIKTNGVGKITEVPIISTGTGFSVAPTLRVASPDNPSGIAVLALTAKNYFDLIEIANTGNAVGNGYAFGVTEGIVYQKGHFLRVNPQTVIVEKYGQSPNAVAAGFLTEESIIDHKIDPDLLDNAFETRNENAPGADRLKLDPVLTILNKEVSDANSSFFSIVEWSEGNAYKQKQFSQYAKIGDAIAKGIFDTSGNFVKESFLQTSRSPLNDALSSEFSSIIVDPGQAYVEGRNVETHRNFSVDIRNGTDSILNNNQTVSLNYGNYIKIQQMAGVFQFNTGDVIDLYDTAKGYYANDALVDTGNTDVVGLKIGEAHVRSLVRDPTIPDTWRLYLFNVQMNTGRNFSQVRSVFYNGTNKGIADVVTTPTVLSNVAAAKIEDPITGGLVFYSGAFSLKNSTNNTYSYRTLDQTENFSNTGVLTKDISANPNEFFIGSGALSNVQLRDIMVVPNFDMVQNSALTGTVNQQSAANTVTGTSTTFLTDLMVGDYVLLFSNGSTSAIRQVTGITNNTHLSFRTNLGFTNTVGTIFRCFPENIPMPFGYRSGLIGNVSASGQVLNLDAGMRFGFSGTSNTFVGVTIQRRSVPQLTKTANRNRFVKVRVANNDGGVNGPWVVGVPDVFRLRHVYWSANSTVNTTCRDLISSFYIDNNQTQDYLGLSWLYLKPRAPVELSTTDDHLLLEFDYFTSPAGGGFYDAVSYVSSNAAVRFETDAKALANLTSDISSWEVPLMKFPSGTTGDFLALYDFRPYATNTAAPDADPASAPINPASTLSFGNTADPVNEKKFPYPDSNFTADVEKWVGRVDSMFMNKNGLIFVKEGPLVDPNRQNLATLPTPPGNMKISDILIPAYPTLPAVRNTRILEVLNTGVANKGWLKVRIKSRTISKPKTRGSESVSQPRVYTMSDIAKIDNRLKNVEYYLAMSTLESDLTRRTILSSVDPTLDRFKYGFFVNDFHDYLNLDTTNPGFSAIVEDDDLVPEKMQWAIPFQALQGPGEFVDVLLSNQDNATEPSTPPPCIPTEEVVDTYFLLQDTAARNFNIQKTFGSVPRAATLFISVTKGKLGTALGDTHPGIVIRQYTNPNAARIIDPGQLIGGTLVADVSDHEDLTVADRTFLVSNAVQNWFASIPTTSLNKGFTGNNTSASGTFKINWNYNPNNGRHVVIQINGNTIDGSNVDWKAVLAAPINNVQVGCLLDEPEAESVIPPPQIIRITGCVNAWKSAAIDLDDFEGDDLSVFDRLTDFEGFRGQVTEDIFVVQRGGVPR